MKTPKTTNRCGITEDSRCVVLGDGSAWIWNTAKELFPQATQILDRFHVKEHLSGVGKIIYGDREQGKKWIQRRYDEFDEGRLKHCKPSIDTPLNIQKLPSVPTTCGMIATACAIRSFTNKVCTPPLGSSRPVAK